MNRVLGLGSLIILPALSASSGSELAAGLADHAIPQSDVLIGYDIHDAALWRYRATAPLQVARQRNGSYLINGRDLVGPDGRLLMRYTGSGPLPPDPVQTFDTAAETWSSATTLLPQALFFTPPVFDPSGNAWTAVSDVSTGDLTAVMKSDALTGTWTEVEPLASVFWSGSIAADSQGDVTFATYAVDSSGATPVFELQVARYEPATGLSAIQTLYSTLEDISIKFGIDV